MQMRLLPLLMAVAIVALFMRVASIVGAGTGLDGTVHAQEKDTAPESQPEAQSENESEAANPAKTAASPNVVQSSNPFGGVVIGLPSNEELELISKLRERREELDKREERLSLQERLLAGTETRIDEKISALKVLEQQIKGHLRIFEEQEAAQLESIVEVYQTMKPKDAAPRFQALDLPVQVDLAMRMSSRKFASLLAEMDQGKATALTVELATRAEPPAIEELGKPLDSR